MSRMMRDAGFVALLLALAASLSWFFSKVRKEGVENYLALLGNQLFATVPDGADKEELKKKYGEFLTEVADRKIPPEQVEKVAAGILNASNAGEALTAAQVEAVLTLATLQPGEIETKLLVHVPPPDPPSLPDLAGPDSLPRPPLTKVGVFSSPKSTPEAWQALNERIKSLYEFNHKLHGELAAPESPRFHMEYRVEPGMKMKLIVDDSLEREIMQRKNETIAREWRLLEEKELVVAQRDLGTRLRKDQERLHRDLQRLRELQRLHPRQAPVKDVQALQALEALKDLPAIASIMVVDSAIIGQEIAKALKNAAQADSLFASDSVRQALQDAGEALREAKSRRNN